LKNLFWWGVFWLGLMGIFFTGSRTVWILTLGLIIFWLIKNKYGIKEKVKFGILLLVLGIILVKIIDFNYPLKNFFGGWDENGMIKRGQLNLAAVEMINKSPWVGVGLGNYLVNLPDFLKTNHIFWLQPVHNIALLLISEIGFLGLIILIWCLAKIKWDKLKEWDWIILGVVLVTGMVDHYWFTLPQNMWLLALVLGVI
jgi:O-antigen ligase